MEKIAFENVRKSYNGRVGCTCGCNGKYTLPSRASVADANTAAGWEAYSESDVSDRRVKIALNKVNKAIEQYASQAKKTDENTYQYHGLDRDANHVWFCYSDCYAAIEVGNRCTTVYF
jgi:CRISPR/Cas system-associated endonuclease/helicase Cas3